MANDFKSKVEITASEGVSAVMDKIAMKSANMARVVSDKTKFMMNDMAGTIGKKMEMIASNTKGLWGASGVVGALGSALVAGGAIETLGSLAEKAESLHTAAIGLGLSTQDLQHWSYAAKQAGVDADMMTRGVANMNKTVFEVAHGGAKAQAELFKQMGVSVRDAKGNTRGITDVAMDVATRFKEHVDRIATLQAHGQFALANTLQAESDNAAQNLFGMKAREVAAMMVHGKQGIQQAFDDADKTGGGFSDEQIEKLERYQAATAKLDFAKQGLMVNLFADKIEMMASKLSGLADKIGIFQKAHPEITKFASSALVAVAGLATIATSAHLAQVALTFMAGGARSVVTALRMLTTASPWLLAIGVAASIIYANWDKIQPVIQRVWNSLKLVWDTIGPLLADFGSAVWETFKDTLSDVWNVVEGVGRALRGLLPSFSGVSDQAAGASDQFQRAADRAENLRGLLDLLKLSAVLATVPFRALATVIETIADKIKDLVSAAKSGGAVGVFLRAFNFKADAEDLAKHGQQNFAGVGDKLAQIAKDADDKSKVVTAEQIRKRTEIAQKATSAQKVVGREGHEAGGTAATIATATRWRAETVSAKPAAVRLDGPVQVDTKGKLGIDLRITADPGLKVGQTGVDTTGASYVGNVGVSQVTP